jgi:hypothetical protein
MAKSFSATSGSTGGRTGRVNTIGQIQANNAAQSDAANAQADSMQDSLASETDRIRRQFATRALMRTGTAS